MGVKSYLVKKLIDLDLVPYSTRWKKSVGGVGRMYADILTMLEENYGPDGVGKLSGVMYNIGLSQASEILSSLGLERNIEGCAYVLLTMHRIFGIRSKIVHRDSRKVVIHVTHCYWGISKKGWTPKTCASIGQYEAGLIDGLLPDSRHFYAKRRSLGNDVCELIVTS